MTVLRIGWKILQITLTKVQASGLSGVDGCLGVDHNNATLYVVMTHILLHTDGAMTTTMTKY